MTLAATVIAHRCRPRWLLLVLLLALFLTPPASAWCIGKLFNNTQPPDDVVTQLFVHRGPTRVQLNVPPRYMWGWGGSLKGYCGSASLQSAALYYGTWLSEQLPRWAAEDGDTEILIGDDSAPGDFSRAAAQFRLVLEHFNTNALSNPQADQFLQWAQGHLLHGHIVIGGVFARFHRMEADKYYDHIVPLVGLTMDAAQNQYAADGVTTNVTGVLYNDLYESVPRVMNAPLASERADFILPDDTPTTFPLGFALPVVADFGMAVTGVVDDFGETYRTKLTAWSWTEPDWGDEDHCGELPAALNLSVAVFGLTAGVEYSILRFDGNESIPSSRFLASGNYSARWNFVANGDTYVASPLDTVMTDTLVSYRTVMSDVQPVTPTASRTQRHAHRTNTLTPTTTPSRVVRGGDRTPSRTLPLPTQPSHPPSHQVNTTSIPASPQPTTANSSSSSTTAPTMAPTAIFSTTAPPAPSVVLESPTITLVLLAGYAEPTEQEFVAQLTQLLNNDSSASNASAHEAVASRFTLRIHIAFLVGSTDRTIHFAFLGADCMDLYHAALSVPVAAWRAVAHAQPSNAATTTTTPQPSSGGGDVDYYRLSLGLGAAAGALIVVAAAVAVYLRRSYRWTRRNEPHLLQREDGP